MSVLKAYLSKTAGVKAPQPIRTAATHPPTKEFVGDIYNGHTRDEARAIIDQLLRENHPQFAGR